MEKRADSESERTSASNDSGSPDGETGGSSRLSSYLQSVAQISGVVTIIAATVYALGVFTLVLPISNNYNSTFAAAWYAASVVPKTVVVGHGIKSLAWPSLALTLGTTLFALLVLWVLYLLAVGWHQGRVITNQSALNVTSLAIIYSFLSVVAMMIYAVFFGEGQVVLNSPAKGFSIETNVQLAVYPAGVLFVLSYSVVAVLAVVRGLRYVRRLIATRAFASVSLRGFVKGVISKGALFMGLSVVFAVTLRAVLDPFYGLPVMLATMDRVHSILMYGFFFSFFLFFPLLLIVILLQIYRGLRFMVALIAEARRNKTSPSISALSKGLGESVAQRAGTVAPALLYSTVLFSALYLVALVALNLLLSFVLPLIGATSEHIKPTSWLHNIFIPLVVLGAFICSVIMHHKGRKGLGHGEYDLISQRGWSSFSRHLLKSIGSRSLRFALLWSFGVAYVVALTSAFLLAYLSPPPLPKVEVNEVAPEQSNRPGQEPAFQGKELALLAHTDGYWYLIDEDEGDLLVVPDHTDKFIKLKLDEQP